MIQLKNINIFLSSTFNDMHAERDYIRKEVLPRLNEKTEEYGIRVNVIDLRWGVDTQKEPEESRESKVLHVCLKAIADCKPYFIVLLGNRYGWVPPKARIKDLLCSENIDNLQNYYLSDVSVTEMEILFGPLSNHTQLKHSIFLFRNPIVYDSIDTAEIETYIDSHNSLNSINKLEALKEKIIGTCKSNNLENNIIPYTPTWNPKSRKFEGLEEMGNAIYNHIINDLKLDSIETLNSNSQKDYLEMESFLGILKHRFCGKKELVNTLTNYLIDNIDASAILKQPSAYVLTGDSGTGKSSVFAEVYFNLVEQQKKEKLIILLHSTGVTLNSRKEEFFLENIANTLSHYCGENTLYDGRAEYELKKIIPELVHKCQIIGYRIVMLLDSFESFISFSQIEKMTFIPSSVRSIITTQPNMANSICRNNPQFKRIDIGHYSYEDARSLVNKILKDNYKELSPVLISQVLNKQDANGNYAYSYAMWVQIAMAILMELGSKDFQEIHNSKADREDKKIEMFLESIIKELPSTPDALFQYFINTSANYFNPPLIKRFLCLIALSRYGISERDLSVILDDCWDELEFQSVFRWMKSFLYQSPIDNKITFSHALLKKTALSADKIIYDDCRKRWVDYLHQSCKHSRISKDELCQLFIEDSDYHSFYLMSNMGYGFSYFIANTLIKEKTEITLEFITRYCELYDDFAISEDVLDHLYSQAIENKQLYSIAETLFKRLLSLFNEESLLQGNAYLIKSYWGLFKGKFNYMEFKDDTINMRRIITTLKNLYFKLRIKFPDDISFIPQTDEYSSFFYYWHAFIFTLNMSDRFGDNPIIVNEYKENFYPFIEEIIWFVDMTDDIEIKTLSMPLFLKHILRPSNYLIDNDELVKISKRVKDKQLSINTLYLSCLDRWNQEKVIGFIADLDSIISPIPIKIEDYINSTNNTEEEKSISVLPRHDDLDDEFSDEDNNCEYKETQEENTLFSGIFIDADDYWSQGNKPESLASMQRHECLIADEISDYSSNFIIDDSLIEMIESINKWYWSRDLYDKYFRFMDSICNKLLRCLYHHIDNWNLMSIFFDLVHKYSIKNQSKDAFELSYRILDVVVRGQLERYFDYYEYYHRDMSYLERYYDVLMPYIDNESDYNRFVADWNYLNCLCGYDAESERYDYGLHSDDDNEHFCALCHQTLAPCTINGITGFANKQHEIILPCVYSKARVFSEGLAAVQIGNEGLWGFVNEKGEIAIPCKFKNVGDFHEGLAWVCDNESKKGFGFRGGKYGFIDKIGNLVIGMEYDDISSFMHGYAIAFKESCIEEIKVMHPSV